MAKTKLKNFLRFNAWVLLLDIAAVNLAYLGALVIRFYNAFWQPTSIGYYLEYFYRFTPWYTVLAVLVFFLFRLYDGMWVYAGLNDMNRIICANLVTVVIQIAGTLIFVGAMPKSYYAIGAFLQLLFTLAIRFAHRFAAMEKNKIDRFRQDTIPALVVGSGDYAKKVIRSLEADTPYRAVLIAGADGGRSMDGVPMIPLEVLEQQIKSKGIRAVFIADDTLDRVARERITVAAEGLELKDYTGYLSNLSGSLPVSTVLDLSDGPVTLVMNGQEKRFDSAREAIETLTRRYEVKRITSPRIELEESGTDESWIKGYQEETGENVSFF